MIYDIFGKPVYTDPYERTKGISGCIGPNKTACPPECIGCTGPTGPEQPVDLGYPDMPSKEDEAIAATLISSFYESYPQLKTDLSKYRRADEPWIQTYSGKKVYPFRLDPNSIDIVDIAHSLSSQCRFTGHTKDFYSVAQHCVLVSYICNQEHSLYGLLHDASESILVDIPSPIKKSQEFDFYRKIEKEVQNIIYKKFGLNEMEPADVKAADLMLLATEARDLMGPLHPGALSDTKPLPFKIEGMGPKEAEKLFLDRFNELYIIEEFDEY